MVIPILLVLYEIYYAAQKIKGTLIYIRPQWGKSYAEMDRGSNVLGVKQVQFV